MLRELLRLIESANGPMTLSELSRRLDVDAGALEGMLDHWVRKGRLKIGGGAAAACSGKNVAGDFCGSCSGASSCPFMARLPRSYSVVRLNDL